MHEKGDVDLSRLPSHVAIIMDGNGRWALKRGKRRTSGHREGLNTAKEIVKTASDLGIPYLTLYTFSTENWNRTKTEINFLMALIKIHLRKELDFYRENNIRLIHSGDLSGLPVDVQREINSLSEQTKQNTGTTVNLAINYGGRDEIKRAVNRWLKDQKTKEVVDPELTEEDISAYLDHPDLPDPDLIIRTGKELRISNFLLWEGAYAEYFFSSKMWPDWQPADFIRAVEDYQNRGRRFGEEK